ncbi:MAG: hypothetical protein NTV22_19050 [bacterium]|nr:hypothetical protein [bacterium]
MLLLVLLLVLQWSKIGSGAEQRGHNAVATRWHMRLTAAGIWGRIIERKAVALFIDRLTIGMTMSVCIRNAARLVGAVGLLLFVAGRPARAGVYITSTIDRVMWDVDSIAVAGTNTSDIVGDMWVSNASVGGAATSFTGSGLSFIAPAIALQLGKNYITVYGKNAAGVVNSDTFNIWRYNIDGSGQQSGSKYGQRWRGTLVGWGYNYYGLRYCPKGNDFVAVAAGYGHSLALRCNGMLVGWGDNSSGQTNCPGGYDIVAMVAGNWHSLALRSNGSLVVWGSYVHSNPSGTNYVAAAAGNGYSLALRSDGTLVGWGNNDYGQKNCPSGSNYVAVTAGWLHSLALRRDGTLVGWGYSGDGRTNCPSGINFVAVSAGGDHSLALRSDGSLVGWGNNDYGQINCPTGNSFVAVAAGDGHSIALRIDGTLVGWGRTNFELSKCPTGNGYIAAAAGAYHSLAIRLSPFVNITNVDTFVNCDTTHFTIGGTNSPFMYTTNRLVGTMWWSNERNGACGTFAANQHWRIANISLGVGTNLIAVYGTNVYGWLGYDSVRVMRAFPTSTQISLVVPVDNYLTNQFAVNFDVAYGDAIAYRYLATNSTPVFSNAQVLTNTDRLTLSRTGTMYWTALGYDSAFNIHWAFETNCLTIYRSTQITLNAPTNDYLSNNSTVGFNVTYGEGLQANYLVTNSVAVFDPVKKFLYSDSLTINSTGTYYWTALGLDRDTNLFWALSTNRFTIQKTLIPGMHLVAPASGTRLTNIFACKLVVDYGAATLDRQLSTNAGISWFEYDADNPVVFNGVSSNRWTARGRTAAGWWPAPETNTLVVTTNYSGDRAIFLLEPADDSIATNFAPRFRVLIYGAAFAFAQVSIDNGAFVTVSLPTNIALSDGLHQWTARGGVLPGPVYTYAPSTNTFMVLPEGLSAGIAALTLTALLARKRSRLRT